MLITYLYGGDRLPSLVGVFTVPEVDGSRGAGGYLPHLTGTR